MDHTQTAEQIESLKDKMSKFAHWKSAKAANQMGYKETTFKHLRAEIGVGRWPYRSVRSMDPL